MTHITQKQAKVIRTIINTLSAGPRFTVQHSEVTYRSWLTRNGIIRELNELLPPHEQVTFARPMVSDADSVSSGGLHQHQTPGNVAEGST